MYSRMLVLHFSKEIVNKPIITRLVRDFDLDFSILKAQVSPRKDGMVVLELQGKRKDYERGIQYLKDIGVEVEPVAQAIRRDNEKCYQCGACTSVCPTGALHINRPTMEVAFESERCSACELCMKACPARAMLLIFDRNAVA